MLNQDIFSAMFAGWDTVRWWRDERTRRHAVTLTVAEERLDDVRNIGCLVQELWPRRVNPARTGVRFHGRLVGKASK